MTGERLANLAAEAPIRLALYGDVTSASRGGACDRVRDWELRGRLPHAAERGRQHGPCLAQRPQRAAGDALRDGRQSYSSCRSRPLVFYAKRLLIEQCTRDTGPASVAALGILATGLSHSLFDNTLSIPAVGMTFAAALGLARSVGAPDVSLGFAYSG